MMDVDGDHDQAEADPSTATPAENTAVIDNTSLTSPQLDGVSEPARSLENATSPASAAGPPKPNYKCQFILSGHTMSISSVDFSPDGNVLASAGMPHRHVQTRT